MTMKREGKGWIPADEYGRSLPAFTVNLLVKDVAKSLPFYRDVLGAEVRYADEDFAALRLMEVDFMLHADHAYDHHPMLGRVRGVSSRVAGAELRVMGIDPDRVDERANRFGATIVQEAKDFPHGWRDVMVADPDGYVWAVGEKIKGMK